jgi:glycosyltransferase involved in cell wall biosynthesis
VPRVSIVIPAHNAAEYLPDTLASVEAQTCADWEVVAVDDGSTDATGEILAAAGPRVRWCRNESARGPAAARNRAVRLASGDCVALLDADDMLRPKYLESQLAALDRARRAGHRVGLVTPDAVVLEDGKPTGYTYLDTVRDRGRPLTLELVLSRNPIYIASLIPTGVGEEVGWFDEELFGTEDFGLWLKILERGYEAIRNPETIAVYRRRSGSVSSNIASQAVNNRRVYELALSRGALSRRQRAIARQAIRYNRAMEIIASARFGDRAARRPGELLRALPLLAWVVATNPRWWSQWLEVLNTGRHPGARAQERCVSPAPDSGSGSENGDVTLVITCFNYGAFLGDALQSALAQEGGPPQITVVDDGSTDAATTAALERLPPGVALIRQENAGLAAARNTGLRRATTPYLIVLDADDRLAPGALRAMRAPMDRDPQLGFCYGVTEFFGDWQGTLSFPDFDPYKLLYRHIIGSTALMRRELYEQTGGYDSAFRRYEDWDFWLGAVAQGWRGVKIPETTLLYRRHGYTMNFDARAGYRRWYGRLRRKHATLHSRTGRTALAAQSDLGPLGRGVYRWWWGGRPLPSRVEGLLQAVLWRVRRPR